MKKKRPAAVKKGGAENVVEAAIKLLRKELGGDAASTLRDGCRSEVREVLPTGIDVLDYHALGIGGLPCGRVVEASGKESVGKSSLTWQVMGSAQRDGALVVFGESEQAIAPAWVDKFGVDRGKVISIDASSFEAFTNGVDTVLEKVRAPKMLIALDSVDSLLLRAEIDAEIDDKDIPGARAKAWSKWMRKVTAKLPEKNAVLFLVNQVRAKIGVQFGAKDATTGGYAIPFYSSVRLSMWRHEMEKKGETKVGAWTGFRVFKNKLAPPLREVHALLSFEGGFDNDASTLEFAIATGAAERAKKDKDGKLKPATTVAEARANLNWPARAETPA